MTDEIPTGDPTTVPISELEELVEDWEWNRDGLITPEGYVMDRCAKELQVVIDEHDPKQ